jgi:hypothetical protein
MPKERKSIDLLSNKELWGLAKDVMGSVGLSRRTAESWYVSESNDKTTGSIQFNLPRIVEESWFNNQILRGIQSHFEDYDCLDKGYKIQTTEDPKNIFVENGDNRYSLNLQIEEYRCKILIKRAI